jgi:hypothetical protein
MRYCRAKGSFQEGGFQVQESLSKRRKIRRKENVEMYIVCLLLHFSTTGIVAVDVQLVGGKVPERDVTLIKECMEAVILLVSEWNSTTSA